MSWSRIVSSPQHARAVLADPGDALDLRARGPQNAAWRELGFTELVPGELVRPVPQQLADVGATRDLGARLATALRAGDLVVLSGPLGAGKTALTQGIGVALGVRGAVTSPTFVLARMHPGPVPLVHVDAYRLRGPHMQASDLDGLDLDEQLPYAVTVVEWGEGLVEPLSPSRLLVQLSAPHEIDGGTTEPDIEGRTALVRPHGPRWAVVHAHNVTT